MQLSASSRLVAFLLAVVGPHDVLASRVKTMQAFQCPPECAECCQPEDWFSRGEFKCLFKDAAKARETFASKDRQKMLIAGRTCRDLKKRKHSHEIRATPMWKIACKYNKGEEKAPKKCSSTFQCCCKENNNWSEDRCFDSEEQRVQRTPNNRSATSELETYELDSHQEEDNLGSCKRSISKHHPYEVPRPEHGNPSYKQVKTVTTGCCIETKKITIDHDWTTMGAAMGNPPRMHTKYHHQNETYTVCKHRERLYKCSPDGGIKWDGSHAYKRIPSDKAGLCIGDEQPDPVSNLKLGGTSWQRVCPDSTFGGQWCKCDHACGYDNGQD